eukprot:TRINITY_DN13546_c0_g1_i1.p1 TRINITY_DN13546_c0_g1~~TRINITY_DN13546_c0_g1_i1.p1  ORF type:complete len:139 (-),score=10.52 TRINITY_DN13546_c0_g1_i1:261-677(-)
MSTIEKENVFALKKPARLQNFHFNFPRELSITPKLLKDITGKLDLSLITTLNLQFKDERFPKIKRISGLEAATNLRILNLSYNMIEKIEGLELPLLVELNLSENSIKAIENLVLFNAMHRVKSCVCRSCICLGTELDA